eukprot:jgi/Ulvmu1/3057/UM015_0097.1
MCVPDDALEMILREAIQAQNLTCLPPEGQLWNSYIDAPNSTWTTWNEMLRARVDTEGPDLVGPDGMLSLTAVSGSRLCVQHLVDATTLSGASVLVEGRTQTSLDALLRSLRGRLISSGKGTSLQWVSAASSAAADVQHLRLLIQGSLTQVHPRLLRSSSHSRVVLQIDDVHAAQPSPTVPSSIIEFIRSYLDLKGFILPPSGFLCHTPDLQLMATAVSSLLPSSDDGMRTRAKMLCIPPLGSRSGLMDGSVLSSFSLLELESTCDRFMTVMQQRMDCAPDAPASQLSAFLASLIQGVHNSGSTETSGMCFDINAVQRMLECVHADLVLPAIDDCLAGATNSRSGDGVAGSAIMQLFGCMLEGQDTEEALARRALMSRSIQVCHKGVWWW